MVKPQNFTVRYRVVDLEDSAGLNEAVRRQYRSLVDAGSPEITRSHYFEGRYENTWIPASTLTSIQPILDFARREAAAFLGSGRVLDVGFWLNEMAPGHVTLAHRHDEDDELLSGVYYIDVPDDSGDLVLEQDCAVTHIRPRPGMMVLFPPEVLHHVTRNLGTGTRLSVGMNFGLRES